MKIRWFTLKTKVTADDIHQLRKHYSFSLLELKKHLENQVGPVLQYFDEEKQEWVDVPDVVEYRS